LQENRVMTPKPIRLFGDPVLRRRSDPIGRVDDETAELIDSLVATVDQASGLGLAAPQIGVARRAIVVVENNEKGDRAHHPVVNPEIVSACGEDVCEEGCLSIPGVYASVKRPQSVVVSGLDRDGRKITIEASGLMARAFAHEIDHLDGILFIDRIGMVKRGLLRKKLNEIKKKAKEMLKSPA
jgi:peptide deformylase